MHWIYISPHLDDIAYSCGGLVWQQTQAGDKVEIWTICAGDPPEGELPPLAEMHHKRWGVGREAVAARREEDKRASEIIGASPRYFSVLDAIYRLHPETGQPVYNAAEEIFGRLNPAESAKIKEIVEILAAELPSEANVVAPLTVGNHVDHQLVSAALHALQIPLWYYADIPYVMKNPEQVSKKVPASARMQTIEHSAETITKWGDAMAAHASQITTFWSDEADMRTSLQAYYELNEGLRMWQTR